MSHLPALIAGIGLLLYLASHALAFFCGHCFLVTPLRLVSFTGIILFALGGVAVAVAMLRRKDRRR